MKTLHEVSQKQALRNRREAQEKADRDAELLALEKETSEQKRKAESEGERRKIRSSGAPAVS